MNLTAALTNSDTGSPGPTKPHTNHHHPASSNAPTPPVQLTNSRMLELLSAQGGTSGDSPAGSEIERKFFRENRCVEVAEGGETTMIFDLSKGAKWKKRVWPRMEYPKKLLRWNSIEELLSYLVSFDRHQHWIATQVPQRPPSGTILFFDRSKTKKYRSDGYDWKTRKAMSKTVREDRMKLRVGGYQLVYGCYAHSASDPNFHRRTYWLIQNPDVVVVHYLDSRDYTTSPSVRHQNQSGLEPHLTPTDWSMMSISDSNLCTLLDMSKTTEASKTLLSQLPVILQSNLLQASNLDEVVVSCNAGLPVDAFEEYSRSKRPTLVNSAYLNGEGSLENGSGDSQPVDAAKAGNAPVKPPSPALVSPSPVTPLGGQGSSQTTTEVLKILSKSPHIIMCCPNNGSVSYILTVPTSDSTTSAPQNHITRSLPRLLPSPTTDRRTNPLVLGPRGVKGKKTRRISMKGTEKMAEGSSENKEMRDSVQRAINGIINPSAAVREGQVRGQGSVGSPSSTTSSYSNAATPSFPSSVHSSSPATPRASRDKPRDLPTKSRDHAASSHDYDPEKFSKFADFLVKMDPIESLSNVPVPGDDPMTSKTASRTSSMESEPMDSSTPLSSPLVMPHPLGTEREQEQETVSHSIDEDSMSWLFSEPGAANTPQHSVRVENHASPSSAIGTSHPPVLQPGSSQDMEDSGTTTTLVDDTYSMDFNLELDAESWKEYLQSSSTKKQQEMPAILNSDLTEGYTSHIDQLVENFSSPGLERYINNTPRSSPNTSQTPNLPQSAIPQVSSADPNSWNRMWQNCSPDSIKNWLQSTIPSDTTGTLPHQIHHSNGSSSPLDPAHSQHLPQDLQDFIFESTASLNIPPTSSNPSAVEYLNRHPLYIKTSMTPMTPVTPVTPRSMDSVALQTRDQMCHTPSTAVNMTQATSDPNSLGGAHFNDFLHASNSPSVHVPPMMPVNPNSASLAMHEGIDYFTTPMTPMNNDLNHSTSHHLDSFNSRHLIPASPITNITPLIPDTTNSSLISDTNSSSVMQDSSHLSSFNLSSHSISNSPAPVPMTSDANPASVHDHSRLSEIVRDRQHSLSGSPAAANFGEFLQPTGGRSAARKISDTSISSEPIFDLEDSQCYPPHQSQLHLSLPDLATAESAYPSILVANADGDSTSESSAGVTSAGVNYSKDTRTSTDGFQSVSMPHPSSSMSPALLQGHSPSMSPALLQGHSPNMSPALLQGAQMQLMEMMEDIPDGFFGSYRTTSSIPSSPSAASVTSSNLSMQDMFDESPSVKELCEMLSDSATMQQSDMALTDSEQDQLFHAAETIQAAFRKYKDRRQLRSKEKNAALLIEKYYKRYREAKEQKDQAARRIQHQYRVYKRRTRELNELSRAATFIQQMYRFHKTRRPSAHPYHRPSIQRND